MRISDWSSDVCSSDLYLVVREAIGAAVPSAGVGCAFARAALEQVAQDQGGLPFDPGCLTEDYELGLRIGAHGGRGVFIRMRDDAGDLVCTREYFPATLTAAVRQKARWMTRSEERRVGKGCVSTCRARWGP